MLALAVFAAFTLPACAHDAKPKAAPAAVAAPPAAAAPASPAGAACASPKAPPKELVKKDLAPGSGRDVKFRSAVLVHYTGWLYDGCKEDLKGAQFDSSLTRKTPFGLVVGAGRVIKGWDEGLVGMKEKDAKRLLIVPPDKGYGDKGAGGVIPPGATLVFEVEMVQLISQPPEEGAAPEAPKK